MAKFINWLSEALYEKPWRFILVSLVFCALMIPQLLTLESDFGVRIWFKADDPLIQDLNELDKLHLDLTLQSIQMINQNVREPYAVIDVNYQLLIISSYLNTQSFF